MEEPRLLVYDLFTRNDPPFPRDLLLVYDICTEVTMRFERFLKAAKRKRRVVKHKHLRLWFHKDLLRKRDVIALEALRGMLMNSCVVSYADAVLMDFCAERGLGHHSLHHFMLFRDIVSNPELVRIYSRAGLMVELELDTIDDHAVLEAITDSLMTAGWWRSLIASAYYSVYNGYIDYVAVRATRRKVLERYGSAKLLIDERLLANDLPVGDEVQTLREMIEFKGELKLATGKVVTERLWKNITRIYDINPHIAEK